MTEPTIKQIDIENSAEGTTIKFLDADGQTHFFTGCTLLEAVLKDIHLNGGVRPSGTMELKFVYTDNEVRREVKKKAPQRPAESRRSPEESRAEQARRNAEAKAEREENRRRDAEREDRETRRRQRQAHANREHRDERKWDPFGRDWRENVRAAKGPDVDWFTLLGKPSTRKEAEKAYKKLAVERHPDRGGTHEAMVELNAAMEIAREVLR